MIDFLNPEDYTLYLHRRYVNRHFFDESSTDPMTQIEYHTEPTWDAVLYDDEGFLLLGGTA